MTGLGQVGQVRVQARRIDAATPPQRDRAVDALRALAIAGVIGGHWLVTALVTGSSHHGTVLHDDSPLASMPWLAPLSWVFQTLAVFFLVGGYSAARGYRGRGKAEYVPWLRKRMVRLARPIVALAAVWVPVTVGMWLAGVPAATVHTIVFLVISPLWFLGVYAVLTALTPAAMWLVRRLGAWAAAFPAAVVAVADLVRFGLHGPGWVGWVNLPAGWLVPYLIGIAWAQGLLTQGSLRGRHGQPVGDDLVPVAPDRVRHGQFRRPAGRPGAGPADRPDGRPVGSRAAHLAAGVRDHAVGPVAGVPPSRARLAGNTPG